MAQATLELTMQAERILALAAQAGALLQEQRLVLATAESCTAGGVAYAITSIAGSSAWFERGFVTYSNDSKLQMLGVAPAYLRDFGAVSEPVARAMALGALSHGGAQIAVAVTGVAGPDGGTPAKPVGTVCFGWAIKRDASAGSWAKATTHQFDGDRAAVRSAAIIEALDGVIRLLRQRQDV
jgi:nicotinamide-nucleotide amidase